MKKWFVVGIVGVTLTTGWLAVRAQPLQMKQERLEFALREFTGATHEVIVQDATAVEYIYPMIVDAVIAEQGRREAKYVRSLPSWSPLKQSWQEWEDFVDTYDPEP